MRDDTKEHTHVSYAAEADIEGRLPSGNPGRRTDLGVLTSMRVVTIVAGALTPFVLVTLFVAKLMMADANTEQDRRLRQDFVERNEFNAWKSDVSRQLDEIKRGQDRLNTKLDEILVAAQKKGK
jgi:hypothetical protein